MFTLGLQVHTGESTLLVTVFGSLNNGPSKMSTSQIPESMDNITLHGKKDFTEVPELRFLRLENYPTLLE